MSRIDDIRALVTAWDAPLCEPAPSTPQSGWPGGAAGCGWCDSRRRDELKDWLERLSRPFIVCGECGNKRCPKAQFHGNDCTGSNESGQAGEWPHKPSVDDARFLLAEIERLNGKLADAWDEGYDAEHCAKSDNPYRTKDAL